jgi:hypothetical protein
MAKTVKAWWFSEKRSLPNGDGREIRIGRTHTHQGNLELCISGLHASRRVLDALGYAGGNLLWRVECSGEMIEGGDKFVCTRRKYLAVIDAEAILRKFARLCALDVIDKRDAPEVVVRYLKTGDDSLRAAARNAAGDAAWDAARDAAWDAARGATRAAAWDAAWVAAWDAARAAARNAARAAAWDAARGATRAAAKDAARDKQNKRLTRMCLRAMKVKK